jgi:hypothetical protein
VDKRTKEVAQPMLLEVVEVKVKEWSLLDTVAARSEFAGDRSTKLRALFLTAPNAALDSLQDVPEDCQWGLGGHRWRGLTDLTVHGGAMSWATLTELTGKLPSFSSLWRSTVC